MDVRTVRERLAGVVGNLRSIGIQSLSVFGSVAAGTARDSSDIDFLVEFEGQATFARYMDLKELLERELGCEIDLVTVKALKPALRSRILNEAVKVA